MTLKKVYGRSQFKILTPKKKIGNPPMKTKNLRNLYLLIVI